MNGTEYIAAFFAVQAAAFLLIALSRSPTPVRILATLMTVLNALISGCAGVA